jgi:hypothetical protein
MGNLLENGIYDATFTGNASVYDSKNKNLTVCFELLVGGEVSRQARVTLTKTGGTEINERSIQNLKDIFPEWNGDDPSWFLTAANIANKKCLCKIENAAGENGQTWSNVTDIRAEGSDGSMGGGELPASMDAKALQAKYGAKFRALSGKAGAVKRSAPKQKAKADEETAF